MYYKLNSICQSLYQSLYFMINVKVSKILAEETFNFKMIHNEQNIYTIKYIQIQLLELSLLNIF